jgi:hypothetical protein
MHRRDGHPPHARPVIMRSPQPSLGKGRIMCLRPPLLWLAVPYLMWPGALGAQGLPFGITLLRSLNFATSPQPGGLRGSSTGQGARL